MANKINIYGDVRVCCKCGSDADVIESGCNYCADCISEKWTGKNIAGLSQEILNKNKLKVVKND
jgi:hypothetical protein|tara:strand:- start:1279 stop:1470 length:192 start_codon:yes stop_codon:yes gene_type:complete